MNLENIWSNFSHCVLLFCNNQHVATRNTDRLVLQKFSLKLYRGKSVSEAENQLQKWWLLWFLSLLPVPFHPHSDPTWISVCQGHQHKKGYERNVAMGLGVGEKYPEGTFLFFKWTEHFTSRYLRTKETLERVYFPYSS
jgi:hypothetical protein